MPGLWEIFVVFFKIGLFAYGGGPAMIPVMRIDVVEGKRWVTDADFRTALALGNSIPGPIAPEMAMWCGWMIAGVPGAIVAAIAVVLPGMILMAILVKVFWSSANSPYLKGAAKGAGIAVIGLLAYVTYDQAYKLFVSKDSNWINGLATHWDWVLIAVITFALVVWRPQLMMPLTITAAAVYGAFFMR